MINLTTDVYLHNTEWHAWVVILRDGKGVHSSFVGSYDDQSMAEVYANEKARDIRELIAAVTT